MSGVGFVGLGRMGFHMATRAARAGHDVVGVDVAPGARSRAEAAGLATAPTLAALAGCDVVFSSLPDTGNVEEAYLDDGGIISLLESGAVCVDLSTVSVEASRSVAASAAARGIRFLDAPVSGTSIHAEAGTLAVMVGGPADALEDVRPVLESFSAAIHHMGPNGAGLEMKLITNRLLTAHVAAIGESIVSMERAGLDVAACLDLLRAGAVPRLLEYKAGPMAARDFDPQFTVDLMSKDLRLAEERRPSGPVTAAGVRLMLAAQSRGLGGADIAAVMVVIEEEMSR